MSETQKPTTGEGEKSPDLTKYIPKEEYEAQKSSLEKLQGDLERVKGQLLDPSYLEYLEEKKNRTKASPEVKSALGALTADEIERLPKARLLEIAEQRIAEKMSGALRAEFKETIAGLQTTVQNLVFERELAETKVKHPDFGTYDKEIREILSRPGANYTYEDAYFLAKAQKGDVSPVKTGAKTEKRSSSEKPSATAPATDFEQKDYKSGKEAADAAIASVRAKHGIEGDTI